MHTKTGGLKVDDASGRAIRHVMHWLPHCDACHLLHKKETIMNKLLLIPAMLIAAQAAYAQTSGSSDPSASKTRAEVKAEERASGSAATRNIEAPGTPSTKGSGTSRAAVKADTRASGSPVKGNIEAPGVPSTRGSGVSRAEVKASERASGSLGTKNIEVPPTPGGRATLRKNKEARSDAK
jgi:hypothetical protein